MLMNQPSMTDTLSHPQTPSHVYPEFSSAPHDSRIPIIIPIPNPPPPLTPNPYPPSSSSSQPPPTPSSNLPAQTLNLLPPMIGLPGTTATTFVPTPPAVTTPAQATASLNALSLDDDDAMNEDDDDDGVEMPVLKTRCQKELRGVCRVSNCVYLHQAQMNKFRPEDIISLPQSQIAT
jgi:hypothetical protein